MKHDKQFWSDKLDSAKKNQELWSKEIKAIENQLGTTGKSGGCTKLNLAGVTMFICRRNTKLTIPFRRWKAFGKLVQLRRKLQMLETTKIPYYEAMVNSHQ